MLSRSAPAQRTTQRCLVGALAAGALVAAGSAVGVASGPPAEVSGHLCQALPDGLQVVVADGDGGAAALTATASEPIASPTLPGPTSLIMRGPDGTTWHEVLPTLADASDGSAAGGDQPGVAVWRVGPDSTDPVEVAMGNVRLSSVGWFGGQSAATVIDYNVPEGEPPESYGAMLVDRADGTQLNLGTSVGIEYGVGSATVASDRVVETAVADLGEVVTFRSADGTVLDDWFSPTTEAPYNAPPFTQWAIAAVDADGAAQLSWVDGPDFDGATGQVMGEWTLELAFAAGGADRRSVALDSVEGFGEPTGAMLQHADFDGRFWVGTFAVGGDGTAMSEVPADPEDALVVVVDVTAAEPFAVDAGCTPGLIPTIDRLGAPEPGATIDDGTEVACTWIDAPDTFPIQRCDRGSAVAAVQQQIVARGQVIEVDGMFGPGTEEAVRNFQSAAGLEVDGLVGPETWGALYTGNPAGSDADGDGIVAPWEVNVDVASTEVPSGSDPEVDVADSLG